MNKTLVAVILAVVLIAVVAPATRSPAIPGGLDNCVVASIGLGMAKVEYAECVHTFWYALDNSWCDGTLVALQAARRRVQQWCHVDDVP